MKIARALFMVTARATAHKKISTMNFRFATFFLLSAAAFAGGCGSSSVVEADAAVAPADARTDAATEAATDAATDECSSKGASYRCQAFASCEPDCMPINGVSCGSSSLFCCVKGVLPPRDAGTDSGG